MVNKNIFPDYENSIMNIAVSILKYYGIDSKHTGLPELEQVLCKNYKNVVFIILDAMGTDILNYHLSKDCLLQKNKKKDITSVFPSTTPVATTSMYSGLSPLEHGWLGWNCYFKECDMELELYNNKDLYTKEKAPKPDFVNSIIGYETINQKINKATNGKIACHEIFPAFRPNGVKSTTEMFSRIENLCNKDGKKFILAYWDEPDASLHKFGCYAKEIADLLQQINRELTDTVNNLKDTLIIVSADHGQIDIGENIFLDEIQELTECMERPPSLGKRVMSFTLKSNKKDLFEQLFKQYFKNDYLLLSKQEFIDKFLGPGKKHHKIDDFVGDFVAVATGNKMFQFRTPGNSDVKPIFANHAGLTHEEMIVPLILIEC